jgi:hypothetical protein
LRHHVLWQHLSSPEVCIIDIDDREDAFHVGVFADERLISIGSFFAIESPRLLIRPQYRLRAMATDPVAPDAVGMKRPPNLCSNGAD